MIEWDRPFWGEGYEREIIVWVDIQKLDASWRKTPYMYVPPGGNGQQDINLYRYEKFGRWLAGFTGKVRMAMIGLDDGEIDFVDGRHRIAWVRDHGAKAAPVVASEDYAPEIKRRFGSRARRCVVRMPKADQ